MNELQLQRLVDGRLTLPELQNVLRRVDGNEAQWKSIATAFVEEQLWQRELRTKSSEDAITIAKSDLLANGQAEDSIPGIAPSREFSSNNAKGQWNGSQMSRWSTLAAILIVVPTAFLIGWMSGNGSSDTPDSINFPSNSVASSNASVNTPIFTQNEVPEASFATINAPYSLQLMDGDQVINAPLLTTAMVRDLKYQPTLRKISNEIQQPLRKQGFELAPELHYVRGQTPDGRLIIVPIETVRLKNFGM
ncbi:MAG: hypothetical protein R3C03_08360 [Pirellulaceae bacterium]